MNSIGLCGSSSAQIPPSVTTLVISSWPSEVSRVASAQMRDIAPRPARHRAGRTEPTRTSSRIQMRRGRKERGHLLVVNLVDSSRKRALEARAIDLAVAEDQLRLA